MTSTVILVKCLLRNATCLGNWCFFGLHDCDTLKQVTVVVYERDRNCFPFCLGLSLSTNLSSFFCSGVPGASYRWNLPSDMQHVGIVGSILATWPWEKVFSFKPEHCKNPRRYFYSWSLHLAPASAMGNQEFCRHYLASNITKSYRDIWLIDAWLQLQYVNVTINIVQYSWICDTLMQPRAFVQLEVPCCGCCSRLRARFYRLEGEVLASDPPEFQNALYWMAHPQHYPRRSGKWHRMPDEMTGFFMKVFFS